MRILVDADACPVKDIIIDLASKNNIPVIMYFDYSHEYSSNYATVIFCDKQRDSVDLKIANSFNDGDLIITQDYGLSALILGKGGLVLHNNGFIINNENIDTLLYTRYLGKKLRDKTHIKGPKKRSIEDDIKFQNKLKDLIEGDLDE